MFKYIWLVMIFIIKLSYGYINVYPSFFYDEIIQQGITKTIVLSNGLNNTVRYRLYLDEETSNKDIYVELYPRSVTLKPLETKYIKVMLKPNSDIKKGNYRIKIVIKEINIPNTKYKKVMTQFKIPFYLYFGDVALSVASYTQDNKIFLKNTGNRLGIFELYALNNNEVEFLDKLILKPNEKVIKKFDLKGKTELKILDDKGQKYLQYRIVGGNL